MLKNHTTAQELVSGCRTQRGLSCQCLSSGAAQRSVRNLALSLALAMLAQTVPPALAELQTVAPGAVAENAKALQVQKVEKGKIWILFVAGAAGLFGGAVLLENNTALFPAISRSNQLMAADRKAQAEEAQRALKEASDERLERAVAAGLSDARQRQAGGGSLPLPRQPSDGSLPAPDSLEASETNALEETYAATHN